MPHSTLKDHWPQFSGNELLPLTTFVKAHPEDKPDTDTSSLRGWETIDSAERLTEIIAQQKAFQL